MTHKLKYTLITIGIVCILAVLAIMIRRPYTVKAPCRLAAHREWSLVQIEPDKLLSRTTTNSPYTTTDFHLLQFDRPDFVRFSLSSGVQEGKVVRRGEIIGTLGSLENRSRRAELQAELERTRAYLQLLREGERIEVREEAERSLEYARAEREAFEPTLRRSRPLYEGNLISREEMEQTEATYRLLELKVLLAETQLKIVQAGARTSEVDMAQAEIQAVESQIRTVEAKLRAGQIAVPIDGLVTNAYAEDVLCTIAGLDTIAVQIPVDERQFQYLKIGSPVRIRVSGHAGHTFVGEVVSTGQTAQQIAGRARFIVNGRIPNPDRHLRPGMTGRAQIYCDEVSLLTVLKRRWRASVGARFLPW